MVPRNLDRVFYCLRYVTMLHVCTVSHVDVINVSISRAGTSSTENTRDTGALPVHFRRAYHLFCEHRRIFDAGRLDVASVLTRYRGGDLSIHIVGDRNTAADNLPKNIQDPLLKLLPAVGSMEDACR